MTTPLELAKRIIEGERLSRGDDLSCLIEGDLAELGQGADAIRVRFSGDVVDLCSIVNGKSGRCPENCRYCAQSAHFRTQCDEYGFMASDEIFLHAKANQDAGVNRFAIVTSGRALAEDDFEKALEAFTLLKKELSIELCASMGLLSRDQLKRLKDAGVRRYHHNIETSRRFFPSICTTHTFEDRLATIADAQSVGLEVCSGGIIGMGETWEERADMALTLSELGILSIPINVLIPISGTPLEGQAQLSEEEILRTVALFRYVNPCAHIRMAAGRKLLPDQGRRLFEFGASAAITGDMLTTVSTTVKNDRAMLARLGRVLLAPNPD